MDTPSEPSPLIALQRRHRTPFDCIAMLAYLLAVHVWGLGIWPLGRDYSVLAEPAAWLTTPEQVFLALQMQVFGGNPLGYQVVNLALLYAAMVCVYFLVNTMLKAPRWFGTLAATLFMANPVHLEAVLNVTGGAMDLLGPLLGLLALALFVHGTDRPRTPWLEAAAATGLVAIWTNPVNIAVAMVAGLHAAVNSTPSARRSPAVWASAGALVVWSLWRLPAALERTEPLPDTLLASFTVLYPLGLLPETTRRLLDHPALFALSGIVIAALVVLVYRKVRHPAMLIGIAGMLIASVIAFRRPVDPYHLVGGGQMVLAAAFAALGLCAVFARMNAHPKWHRPTVYLTTVVCIVLFGMTISGTVAWRDAGREVRAFQADAALTPPEETLCVAPDWQYWNGAPLKLSHSILFDTPFSRRVPHEAVLPLNRPARAAMHAEVRAWSMSEGIIAIPSGDVLNQAVYPYHLTAPGSAIHDAGTTVTVVEISSEETVYRVEREGLPRRTLPATNDPERSGTR